MDIFIDLVTGKQLKILTKIVLILIIRLQQFLL